MKIFFVIAACVLSIVVFTKGNHTELLEDLIKCGKKFNATEDDMEKLVAHQIPDTKTGQCTIACFSKKYNMMTKENNINIDGMKSFMEKIMPKDDFLPEKFIAILNDCSKELTTESDECLAAKNIIYCIIPKVHKYIINRVTH